MNTLGGSRFTDDNCQDFGCCLIPSQSIINLPLSVISSGRNKPTWDILLRPGWVWKVPLSEICSAGFRVLHQPRCQGRGSNCPLGISGHLQAPHLLLVRSYFKDKAYRISWTCCYSTSIAKSLPDLLEAASRLVVELSEFMNLGNFDMLWLRLP